MPNLDTIGALDWLQGLHPGQRLPDWPPPIRAIEEPSEHAKALEELGSDLDEDRHGAETVTRALLADPGAANELAACLCQLGAARLLSLMHFLTENQNAAAPPPAIVLTSRQSAEATALRAALKALSRRFTLQRMFSPERLATLRAAMADPTREASL
jgi:hypothetical protein